VGNSCAWRSRGCLICEIRLGVAVCLRRLGLIRVSPWFRGVIVLVHAQLGSGELSYCSMLKLCMLPL
jgi:hypothetical protein